MDRKRVVVVTGADRGLGYELVRQFLQQGDTVFAGRYRKNWHLLDELLIQFPDTLYVMPLDVRSDVSVTEAAKIILSKTNEIDILLNVAGVWLSQQSGTVLDGHFDFVQMMEEYNVNALGALRVMQSLVHAVLNGFDKLIINISSEAGSIRNCSKTDQPGYCMSKSALNMGSCIAFNAIRPFGGAMLNLHPGWMQSVIGSSAEPDAPYVDLPNQKDVKFYTTPEHTAAGILKLIEEPERFAAIHPGFVNYYGDLMEY